MLAKPASTLPLLLLLQVSLGIASPSGAPLVTGTNGAPSTGSKPVDKVLHLQVLLDRAGFSVGIIDGRNGSNTREALAAFQESRGQAVTGQPDDAALSALGAGGQPAVQPYRIAPSDVERPFIGRLPKDLMEQGELEALGYVNVLEQLSERFHTTEHVLRALNPAARFVAGDSIQVPAVTPIELPPESKRRDEPGAATQGVDSVIVTQTPAHVRVRDANGATIFYAPVTSGSEHDPLPLGTWKVTDIYLLPKFHYNPDLFWDADVSHAKTVIAPGPNNPVGAAWIDIDKEHYGLHGTPEPSSVGKTASHGCVRLTNWDILRLATYVKPGTRVIFRGSV